MTAQAKMTRFIFLTIAIGLISCGLSRYWTRSYWPDLNPPLCSARRLVSGLEPYVNCATVYYDGNPAAQYPMTTILALVPLAALPGSWPVSVAWGLVNGLLAFGILRTGQPWRFLIFASGPYALAFVYHQPSPLIAAVMLLPSLLPLALIKPQTGLPVILTNLTPRRALACLIFIALTFAVYPRWPLAWWQTARNYDGVIPLLSPFGFLLFLALLRPRSRESWTLFLFALVPQRSIYDLVPLMLLPRSKIQTGAIVALSWIPVLSLFLSGAGARAALMPVLSIYLPILACLTYQDYLTATARLITGRLREEKETMSAGPPPAGSDAPL